MENQTIAVKTRVTGGGLGSNHNETILLPTRG